MEQREKLKKEWLEDQEKTKSELVADCDDGFVLLYVGLDVWIASKIRINSILIDSDHFIHVCMYGHHLFGVAQLLIDSYFRCSCSPFVFQSIH